MKHKSIDLVGMKKTKGEYKIIIVDDEPMVTSSLSTLLTLEGDYAPITFNSPTKAIEFIEKSEVDLVISDFLMPEMNGIDFLTKVKSFHPGASLILLTGYADKESAIRAINELGLYRYIEKPWSNEDILLCVRNGLERSHLIENLEHKISELSQAKLKLEQYNLELEQIVKARTEDLIKSNTELNAIIHNCADGILTISQTGEILHSNPAFRKLVGIDSNSSLNCTEIFLNDKNTSILEKLNPEHEIFIREYKLFNQNKQKFIPIEVSFAPVFSPNTKEISYYVGVIRDITLQQEMERLRDDFIATLTHDLRTPLLAAIQTLKFFLDGSLGSLTDKQKILLETMLHSNQDMLGLVNALLEVYKYESGQLVLCKDIISLNDLISNCAQEIKPLAKKKNITVSIPEQKKIDIYADKQELRRVIANLLGNAINYTPREGNISISYEEVQDNITISVEDTGMGIPAEDIPKLFNRFSQGTSQKRSTGTGLGLYLSRQIIEAHNGKIWLESELGRGSKFIFSIPSFKSKELK